MSSVLYYRCTKELPESTEISIFDSKENELFTISFFDANIKSFRLNQYPTIIQVDNKLFYINYNTFKWSVVNRIVFLDDADEKLIKKAYNKYVDVVNLLQKELDLNSDFRLPSSLIYVSRNQPSEYYYRIKYNSPFIILQGKKYNVDVYGYITPFFLKNTHEECDYNVYSSYRQLYLNESDYELAKNLKFGPELMLNYFARKNILVCIDNMLYIKKTNQLIKLFELENLYSVLVPSKDILDKKDKLIW